jgi:2-oxo-3-hexenedioate decarboxylase
LDTTQIESLAKRLHDARLAGHSIEKISNDDVVLTMADSYEIQACGMKLRQNSNETIIGMKMGLTSEAKRKQMDLDSPIYGVLTDKMKVENNGTYSLTSQIHPKIEPEIAFITNRDLSGKITREEALSALGSVCATMEILDSRYKNFKYFSLEDVVADNSSSSQFILGDTITDVNSLDLKNLKMTMKVNGEIAQSGTSDAISGDPILSLVELLNLLSTKNLTLPAGSIVLAGAATPAVSLEPGMDITLEVDQLPPVNINVAE